MTRSRAGIILWSPTVFFVLLPQLSSGLLSDFKICGDAECESLMSRVQAIRDHRGKDCRFLSFRRGETIFVHHKLTGKRNHLWAGSMNKQFGYFPKEAVKEEQKFVTKEIVVETQESDFLCMDDTGYPIDSSHLDTEDDYDSDLKTLPEKSEMSQTRKYTDETKSETPTSKDTASESLSTAGEEVEYQDNGGAKTNQESPETAVELKEKGGSPASSWLSSSVTEWFDGGNWDEPDNSAEVKKHLMQGDYSLMSSVTGWLRLGNKGKTDSPEDSENHQQNDRKTESFTSAMTGWLGFSGDEKAESCEEKEYDDEKEMDMKTASADNFKSRKLNLNSETQQIQEKINEMGTLGWLGNGLSRTLGFGINDQDTGNTIQVIAEEGEKIDKQKASSSWFDVEIKDILGFRKENPADTTETDTKSSRNVQGHDNRAASVDSKHRELADTSQVDQNNNPPQNQKVDMYPILNGKEGENKFDILASKNDVTSMPTFTYMVSKSVGQVVSEIKDSKKDQIEENDDPEFTKQVENIGTSNIQSIYGAADVECKGERTVTEIKFDESAKQSQVQESGSSLESETVVKESEKDKKQEEVHTKKVENIEKQQNVEYTKVVVQNKFQEKTQGEFKKGVIQKNWKVTYNNTNEDENSLEFGSDFFEKKDAEMTHENLSEQDKEKHLHENTPSQDTKNMESPYLQGTVTSVINFLKESSFVSYLGPESEDNEYKEEEHKELGEGEEQNEIMKMEEQEDSQVLTEKWKETVRRQRKKQQDLISREKQKPLEELKFKTPEHLTEVERVYYRKHGEFIEKTKEEDVALKDTKEGITELIQKEQIETFDNEKHKEFKQVDKQEEMQMLDHKHEVVGASVMKIQNKLFALDDLEWDMSEERDKLTNIVIDEMDGKLGNFTQKEEADEFEDEKQEGFERGKRGEVVIVLGEKTQEVVEGLNEEKLEDFVDKQEEVGELEETKYQVSGESEEAFEGERQEELEPKEQVGQRFEKTHKGDSESSGLLEDKGQEDFKDREWKEVQKLEKYEVDSKPREELEEKENMEEIKVKQQSKVGKLEKRYEMRSESGDGMEQKKHEEVEMLKYDEDGESEGLEEKDNMEINVNQNEVGKLEKKYEVSGEPGEELQEKSLQMKHKKQEEVEKLEKYEVDGESVENLEEEHIYVKQEEVEKLEKKYEVSGESREELDHKGKEKFKDRDLEKLEKLEKYDVNVESIERFENKMQENFTDKEQEGVEKLDKVEKDYDSGEDLQEKEKMEAVKIKKEKEARDSEEPNQFEPRKQEDLYKGLNRTEVEEKRKGGVRKWKHVELVQIKEEETQEFNRDLKVSEDIHVSEFVERRDVKEVIESVECMDKLCTQIDQNEVITERGEHSFEDDSNKVTKGSGGIFGLFNKVISLDQRPINKMKELTNSHAAFAGKANEMLKEKPFQTPKEELDATTNNDKDLQENFLPPSPSLTQNSQSSFLLSNTAKTHQPKPLPNNYKILQDYVGREEATILVELFGAKKLKLLDYILGHPDVFTEDVDESIVLDTETLLHYCREELFTASIQLSDAPDDKENTRTIFAIQKVQILLKRARETFNARKSAINRANSQARPSYVDASCPACSKDQETARVMVGKQKDGGPEKNEKNTGRCEEISLVEKANKLSHSQTVPSELLEGVMLQPDVIHHIQEQSSSQTHAMKDFLKWLKLQVVSSLPDDIRPGPDLYGIPWEPIVISSLLGLVVVLLFSCRCYSAVKSRMYRRKEWWMAEQVAQLVEEKCEVLATLSKCQQEYDKLENLLSDSDVSDETHKTRDLEVRARHLDLAKTQLEENLQELKDQLDQQRAHRIEQEKKITLLAESMQAMEEETKELQSQEQQAQTTIKVYNMNTDRLQRNLETTEEENSLLKESSKHLRQQMEGWSERVSELEEEMRRYEMAHSGMVQDVANKDERIMSLTNRLLGMKAWDADLECDGGESSKETTARAERNGKIDLTNSEGHLQKVQKLVYAAKLNADLKSIDEDKDRVFAKLNDEVKAKEDLEVSIKELENERLSMQADTEHYSEQVQRLQQKLQIMTEMYQENELKLHRLLTVEEKERLQKEDKLNKADKNIALAMEELNNYKLRAGEMEEELEKTKQSYQTQISAHEKKAHNNWLAARAADRELSDIKRENALLRQKLTDTQFKLDALDKDPFALDSLARPLPFRAERLPYGPSPLGHPASENRASLSPPTLLDGPLSRLSPRGRAPIEPPTAQGELERSGGPHSDSGSISPSWERDRRGPPPGGPGPFPPQGGPVYRRPGPPPGVMGPLLPPGPPFPHPRSLPNSGPQGPMYPVDSTDGVQRENSFGPEQAPREPGPGDRRTPPESALRMVLPPMGPIDAPFPRRAPFRPPDFFPSRGPGGPPMMPMWAPRPGMMLPPRYPPGGLPPPHLLSYGPLMRPPPPNDLAPTSMGPPTSQQNLPSVPHSQSQDEQMSFP